MNWFLFTCSIRAIFSFVVVVHLLGLDLDLNRGFDRFLRLLVDVLVRLVEAGVGLFIVKVLAASRRVDGTDVTAADQMSILVAATKVFLAIVVVVVTIVGASTSTRASSHLAIVGSIYSGLTTIVAGVGTTITSMRVGGVATHPGVKVGVLLVVVPVIVVLPQSSLVPGSTRSPSG